MPHLRYCYTRYVTHNCKHLFNKAFPVVIWFFSNTCICDSQCVQTNSQHFNRVCRTGGHYWDYYTGTLSLHSFGCLLIWRSGACWFSQQLPDLQMNCCDLNTLGPEWNGHHLVDDIFTAAECNWQVIVIGLDQGLLPVQCQAITWTNDEPVYDSYINGLVQ